MIKVYGIPNCNSVKKAVDWLKANNLEYEFHDYKKKGITAAKLKQWSKHFGWENLLNKAGTTWKGLGEDDKNAVTSEAKAIQLMTANTSVIKRPIIETGDDYLVRFNEEEYAGKLLK
jgi:arsenate reductase (glutaredoxin)